jgi:20S proteasome alpha/beta subunit
MTLIVAMKAVDAIILAADSRGTVGDPRGLTAINDTQTKLYQVGPCGLAIAGASELALTLLDELKKKNIGHGSTTADKAVDRVYRECAELYRGWFKDIPVDKRPAVLMIMGGYRGTAATREAVVYLLNSEFNFAPQLFGSNPCMAGVPQYAVYLVNRYYDPSISRERARALAEYLIAETASQDPKVGGPIKIAEIDPATGYRERADAEVDKIHDENASLNRDLRKFFFEGQAMKVYKVADGGYFVQAYSEQTVTGASGYSNQMIGMRDPPAELRPSEERPAEPDDRADEDAGEAPGLRASP